jgi:uncharacterized protein (TIGR03437 family)
VIVAGVPARISYASPTQINAVLPDPLAVGEASVEVRVAGRRSAPKTIDVVSTAPALFTVDGSGSGLARAFHAGTFAPLTPENPAERGTVIVAYGTGMGRAERVVVKIGGSEVRPEYAGPAPGFDGVFQLNVRLPETLQAGNHAMQLTTDTAVSNSVEISVK